MLSIVHLTKSLITFIGIHVDSNKPILGLDPEKAKELEVKEKENQILRENVALVESRNIVLLRNSVLEGIKKQNEEGIKYNYA